MVAALISGAGGGIGRALCEAFATAGYRVVATDLHERPVCCDAFVAADLARVWREADYRDRFLTELHAAIGPAGLRALINNAAVQVVADTPSTTPEDWNATLEVNLLAPFALIQALLPQLEAARGCVVNVGSVHAALTAPRSVCYATSKAALAGMTRALAVDLRGAVRVNCLQPAATDTAMLRSRFGEDAAAWCELAACHPLGRIAAPAEIAAAAVFLASDAASFVNAACLDVGGGIAARLHNPEGPR